MGKSFEIDPQNYSQTCRNAVESALTQLNSSVNWSMTVSIAMCAITFQCTSSNVLTDYSILLLIATLVFGFWVVLNFFTRTGKSYINVIRFSSVERVLLKELVDNSNEESSFDYNKAITDYIIDWKSPIPMIKVLSKVMFEFGFVIWLHLSICLTYFVSFKLSENYSFVMSILPIVWFFLILIEVLILAKPPYINSVKIDKDANKKA